MSSKCRAHVEQLSSKCRADVEQMSSRCQADVEQMSSRCRANAEQMPSKCHGAGRRGCANPQRTRRHHFHNVGGAVIEWLLRQRVRSALAGEPILRVLATVPSCARSPWPLSVEMAKTRAFTRMWTKRSQYNRQLRQDNQRQSDSRGPFVSTALQCGNSSQIPRSHAGLPSR